MLARTCDSCKKLIDQKKYLELQIRVLNPNEEPDQDAHSFYGDYCEHCLLEGLALEDLIKDWHTWQTKEKTME